MCAAIESEIAAAERQQSGELCFLAEAASDFGALRAGVTPRQRALAHFARLGVWDTADNNGTLIYVSLADRCVVVDARIRVATPATSRRTKTW